MHSCGDESLGNFQRTRPMTRSESLPETSPDGRFRIRLDEMEDRGTIQASTFLVSVLENRDIVWLGETIEGGFLPDGMLRVVWPPWNGCDVLIDPARECFRTREDQPWLPLAAWQLADSAYRQGWANGIEFRTSDPSFGFPWVELWMAIGAVALVVLLAWKPWLDDVPRATLIIVSALVAVLFIYIAAINWRGWRHACDLRPTKGPPQQR